MSRGNILCGGRDGSEKRFLGRRKSICKGLLEMELGRFMTSKEKKGKDETGEVGKGQIM